MIVGPAYVDHCAIIKFGVRCLLCWPRRMSPRSIMIPTETTHRRVTVGAIGNYTGCQVWHSIFSFRVGGTPGLPLPSASI
jgi:hypothetical protein